MDETLNVGAMSDADFLHLGSYKEERYCCFHDRHEFEGTLIKWQRFFFKMFCADESCIIAIKFYERDPT